MNFPRLLPFVSLRFQNASCSSSPTHFRVIVLVLISSILYSCGSTSHVLLGQQREPIGVERVIVYSEPPAEFEKVAILQSSSRNSWRFTDQGKMDQAMLRLKQEAASLGANGILLESTGEESSGYIATDSGTFNNNSSFGLTLGMPLTHKTATGIAIWVNKGQRHAVSATDNSAPNSN